MEKVKQKNTKTHLIAAIIEGARRKKGLKILDLDLTKLNNTECSHFIICHGTSNTQVEAIAHSIEETVEEITGQDVWHTDGYKNAQWILLDYAEIMVHVFHEEWRKHYDLEQLWADAEFNNYNSEN